MHYDYAPDGQVYRELHYDQGRLVKEVLRENPGYYGWMMDADFPQYTKRILRKVRESMEVGRG